MMLLQIIEFTFLQKWAPSCKRIAKLAQKLRFINLCMRKAAHMRERQRDTERRKTWIWACLNVIIISPWNLDAEKNQLGTIKIPTILLILKSTKFGKFLFLDNEFSRSTDSFFWKFNFAFKLFWLVMFIFFSPIKCTFSFWFIFHLHFLRYWLMIWHQKVSLSWCHEATIASGGNLVGSLKLVFVCLLIFSICFC